MDHVKASLAHFGKALKAFPKEALEIRVMDLYIPTRPHGYVPDRNGGSASRLSPTSFVNLFLGSPLSVTPGSERTVCLVASDMRPWDGGAAERNSTTF
ncbi:hypothetical protein OG851_42185 (plasmid) [Streptomyces sp. NBC_00161]|uniref:hypothetical protein n=1 Tax=Streptomyces sp. NBC_00161 TaxID=2975671 RepID=UPI003255C273